MREITYRQALQDALREEMQRDDAVFLLGEDIAEFGGSYKVTAGLLDAFGAERVRNTPISEAAIVGAALGAALVGMRPVAELMWNTSRSVQSPAAPCRSRAAHSCITGSTL
jgi:pyruvate/2-oxoglutarate/acetoin dehydrogenase E1 component